MQLTPPKFWKKTTHGEQSTHAMLFSAMVVGQDLDSCSVSSNAEAIRKQGFYFPLLAKGLWTHFLFSCVSQNSFKKKNLKLVSTENILVVEKQNETVKLAPRVQTIITASLRKKPNVIRLIINILSHFYEINTYLCPVSDDFACPPGMPRGQCRL